MKLWDSISSSWSKACCRVLRASLVASAFASCSFACDLHAQPHLSDPAMKLRPKHLQSMAHLSALTTDCHAASVAALANAVAWLWVASAALSASSLCSSAMSLTCCTCLAEISVICVQQLSGACQSASDARRRPWCGVIVDCIMYVVCRLSSPTLPTWLL